MTGSPPPAEEPPSTPEWASSGLPNAVRGEEQAASPFPRRPGLDRRTFLSLAIGGGALGVMGATLGPQAWDALFGGVPTGSGATGASGDMKLVLVTLYGGNDGLNTVIPYQDPTYAAARGALAVDASTVLPLSEGFGLHPSMPGFKKLWEKRELAVVHGVGFSDPNYSHFESMDIWQSGVPENPVSTGWLGRWLDVTKSSPLRAIALGPTLPTALSGERVQGAAIPVGALVLPGGPVEQSLYAAVARPGADRSVLAARAADSDGVLLEVHERLGPILAKGATSNPLQLPQLANQNAGATSALAIANGGGGQASGDVLAVQLSTVANLILSGASADVYSVELGGFDTHADQAPVQENLLEQLDTAVSAFVGALRGTKRGSRTVVLVYTEFGRRIGANASAGTDHGWANIAFVAGPSVKGGFYGEPPSLTKLSEGNTVYTTDFRRLYATVLGSVLGVDPKPILGGAYKPLQLV